MTPLLTAIFTILITTSVYAQTYTVKRVIDGDTIIVTMDGKDETVKLIGIDAPENEPNDKAKRDSERTGQDLETIIKMGQKAKKFLIMFLNGEEDVMLEFDVQNRDKHGRLLAYVWFYPSSFHVKKVFFDIKVDTPFQSMTMLNNTILKSGYATPMTIPPNVKHADLFKELYDEAKENKRGLWASDLMIKTNDEAASATQKFLNINKLNWGEPTRIIMTVSKWYRVEYGVRVDGVERFLLVNPKDGNVEFPIPR